LIARLVKLFVHRERAAQIGAISEPAIEQHAGEQQIGLEVRHVIQQPALAARQKPVSQSFIVVGAMVDGPFVGCGQAHRDVPPSRSAAPINQPKRSYFAHLDAAIAVPAGSLVERHHVFLRVHNPFDQRSQFLKGDALFFEEGVVVIDATNPTDNVAKTSFGNVGINAGSTSETEQSGEDHG
jgi:hypothetical protein